MGAMTGSNLAAQFATQHRLLLLPAKTKRPGDQVSAAQKALIRSMSDSLHRSDILGTAPSDSRGRGVV